MTYNNGDICLKSFPVLETVTESVPPGSFFYMIEKKHMKLYHRDLNGMGQSRKNKLKPVPGTPESVTVTPDHRGFNSNYDLEWK